MFGNLPPTTHLQIPFEQPNNIGKKYCQHFKCSGIIFAKTISKLNFANFILVWKVSHKTIVG
ncbi:uncharacterized protein ASCRUDRAFT_80578 [Ascoidea rubescens DSM 1968]|uniref:Uncharacterized protein n=1 Tax=Ascoidea rubescens DSM 1968 TaxID=1344418 RepID=A0A1D2VJ11_9ASCO|nr:hypothetical protein ASCRUDRAFT_80578 [Ascoidea rubescens DSM 1968]ODV61513.1 hypothetical protein ASCRUDRAFT_80578 [Ascoidea rubescens DSM 1968]